MILFQRVTLLHLRENFFSGGGETRPLFPEKQGLPNNKEEKKCPTFVFGQEKLLLVRPTVSPERKRGIKPALVCHLGEGGKPEEEEEDGKRVTRTCFDPPFSYFFVAKPFSTVGSFVVLFMQHR